MEQLDGFGFGEPIDGYPRPSRNNIGDIFRIDYGFFGGVLGRREILFFRVIVDVLGRREILRLCIGVEGFQSGLKLQLAIA